MCSPSLIVLHNTRDSPYYSREAVSFIGVPEVGWFPFVHFIILCFDFIPKSNGGGYIGEERGGERRGKGQREREGEEEKKGTDRHNKAKKKKQRVHT